MWSTSRALTIAFALMTLIGGLLPAGVAYLGQLIVDSVVHESRTPPGDPGSVLRLVGAEALLVADWPPGLPIPSGPSARAFSQTGRCR